jgi:hypothetical protein
MAIKYPPTTNGLQKQLDADLNSGVTVSMTLTNTTGVQNKPGVVVINRIDTSGNTLASSVREYIAFTGTSGATLTGLTRGLGGSSEQDHATGAVVEFIFDVVTAQGLIDTVIAEHNDDGTHSDITADSITLASGATPTAILDEDDMATDSATALATQQSIKAYADSIQDQPNSSMSRQAIMNGNFDVWQRGTSLAISSSGTYLADRWATGYTTDGGTLPTDTVSRQSLTPGDIANAFYFHRLTVDGAGTSFGSNALYATYQRIEYGTRNLCGLNKTVTVSFWAKSDIADKKIGVYLIQNYGTGGTPTTAESINGTNWTLTSTWTKYTHTFTTNTLVGKTFGTANDDYIQLQLMHMWGDTVDAFVGDTVAEDFGGAGDIDIAQVQLCAGEVALPFQPKSYAQELADCQRYYYRLEGTGQTAYFGFCKTTTVARVAHTFPVTMRTQPTPSNATVTGSIFQLLFAATGAAITGISHSGYTSQSTYLEATIGAASLTVGQATILYLGDATAWIAFSAEL